MRVVLLAAALLVATVPLATASERCSAVEADRLEPLATLPGLGSNWVALLAFDEDRIPAIPSVVAQGPAGLCAVTGNVAGFARIAGITAPEDRAALAIAASFPDQLGIPEVRSLRIADGKAHATSWSAKDGLVADWTVDLATLRADFVVTDVAQGAFAEGFEGWHPWVGFSSQYLRDLENGALVTKTLFQPLPDGKQFRLTYFTENYASEAQADQYAADYAAAALAIWTIENQQWGFVSGDPDGTYDIRMDGCSCISGGFNVAIRVHAKLEDLYTLFNPPLSYPTVQHFFRVVIGHEWHHHLQYSINQWALGNYLTEGGARFSETIFEPEGAHGPNTITYLRNANGFSNVMLNPNASPTTRTYDYGLFWGYLYSTNGGIPLLREVYEESTQGGSLYDVVTRALNNVPGGAHATFDEANAGFALAMYGKDFVWGKADGSQPRQWGAYLPDVKREPMSMTGIVGRGEGTVAQRGAMFVDVPLDSDPIATQYGGDGALHARWAWTTPTGIMARPAGLVYVIEDGPVSKPALVLTRGPTVPNDAGQRVFGAGKFQAVVEGLGEVLPPL